MKKYLAVLAYLFLAITNISAYEEEMRRFCESNDGSWMYDNKLKAMLCSGLTPYNIDVFNKSYPEYAEYLRAERARVKTEIEKEEQRKADRETEIKRIAAEKERIAAEKERIAAEKERIAAENERIAAERIAGVRQALCNNWKAKLDGLSGVEKIKFYSEVKNLGCR